MIKIKNEECIGCGLCVSLCPDVFVLGKDYKAVVVNDINKDCAKKAALNCPVNAIII
ncbi:MAG: ferredoxin [Clostridia bacterium]|nr:ferredoxin [Clostridia bacterium]